MNKSQVFLLKMVATFLMKKHGSTTTLEIKEELRERFPKQTWYQSDISQAMIDIHDSGEIKGLEFVDTGEFRIYQKTDGSDIPQVMSTNAIDVPVVSNATLTTTSTVSKAKKAVKAKPTSGSVSSLSRTAVVDLMRDSKGKFYTVTFIKTDGSERTMNGQTKKDNFMDNLGYINFRESNGNIRRVNPKTIKEISISGNIYKVK